MTIGIASSFPATGYGYIRYDKNETAVAKHVKEFKENRMEKQPEISEDGRVCMEQWNVHLEGGYCTGGVQNSDS